MGSDPSVLAKIIELIEADVEKLVDFRFAKSLTPAMDLYRQALLAYHRGDAKALERFREDARKQIEIPCLDSMIDARIQILARRPAASFVEKFSEQKNEFWRGEILILSAAIQEILGDFESARTLHEEAAIELERIGAFGKALRAESNAVVNLSNIEPDRRMIPEYTIIVQKAKKLRQWNVVAMTLLNISREYQRLGAFKNALRFCNRALSASKTNPGGIAYFLILAHRAHLLLDLGRRLEAEVDLELAKTSDFAAVQDACKVLDVLFGGEKFQETPTALKTWRERLDDRDKPRPLLSPVEESVVRLIAEKPRSKFEITDAIFGVDLDPLKAENRLKNLIHRIRKKIPGLVVLKGDFYAIAEPELEVLKKAKRGS